MVLLFVAVTAVRVNAQTIDAEQDKCGTLEQMLLRLAAPYSIENWGYGYDSLRADLVRWRTSPYLKVDSVGVTTQGRTM